MAQTKTDLVRGISVIVAAAVTLICSVAPLLLWSEDNKTRSWFIPVMVAQVTSSPFELLS
jgi:hypothetical protein